MKLTEIIKKTHDACGDEIDGYHAATHEALKRARKAHKEDNQAEVARHLHDAEAHLMKAIKLAKSWDRYCG